MPKPKEPAKVGDASLELEPPVSAPVHQANGDGRPPGVWTHETDRSELETFTCRLADVERGLEAMTVRVDRLETAQRQQVDALTKISQDVASLMGRNQRPLLVALAVVVGDLTARSMHLEYVLSLRRDGDSPAAKVTRWPSRFSPDAYDAHKEVVTKNLLAYLDDELAKEDRVAAAG